MEIVKLGCRSYDGSQLRHAFAYEEARVLGPTITFFHGPADVEDHLVDLEDSLAKDFIKSASMWHFIVEIPEATIMEMVILQRLFICQCIEFLSKKCAHTNLKFARYGDDIFVDDAKLSVSIATLSRFSGLMHVGINISVGPDCPVKAVGLENFCEHPVIESFGTSMAECFVSEYGDIKAATYKVTEVK